MKPENVRILLEAAILFKISIAEASVIVESNRRAETSGGVMRFSTDIFLISSSTEGCRGTSVEESNIPINEEKCNNLKYITIFLLFY